MNRALAGLAAFTLTLSLTACSTSDSDSPDDANSSPTASTAEGNGFPGLGEEVSADGATIVIHDIARVAEMEMCPEGYQCGYQPNEILKADEGGEFLILNSTVTNNSKEPMDLTCSLPIDTAVVNKQEQTYSVVENDDKIPGNPECNEQLQPGFDAEMKWVYMIPTGTELDYFMFHEVNLEKAFNSDEQSEVGYIDLSKATPKTSFSPETTTAEPTSTGSEVTGEEPAESSPQAEAEPAPSETSTHYRCAGTDAYTWDPSDCFGEALTPEQDQQLMNDYYAEQERLSKIPMADGGTCAAAECGYGHDANGNPNPSSGEIQLMDGCRKGYIDDPENCAAVQAKSDQYGWGL